MACRMCFIIYNSICEIQFLTCHPQSLDQLLARFEPLLLAPHLSVVRDEHSERDSGHECRRQPLISCRHNSPRSHRLVRNARHHAWCKFFTGIRRSQGVSQLIVQVVTHVTDPCLVGE